MKSVIVTALFVVAATVVDASSVRVKKDVGSKNSEQCVYADVSKTGKKTIVCGDPAPPTLASILASQLQRQSTAPEARVPSEKCFDLHKSKPTPVSVYVQPQPVMHHEQPHYEQLHVMHHQVPQVQYVQQQPQIHYVQQPQPLVHYQPTVVYQKPVAHVQPYKSPCSQYGCYSDGGYSSGGYLGGGYRMTDDAYPTAVLTRTVGDADEIADPDDVYEDENVGPITQNYLEAGPYDGNAAVARKGFGSGRPRTVAMRPMFVPAMVKSADPYGNEDGAGPEWQPQQRFVSEPEIQFPSQFSQQAMVGRFPSVERSMTSAVAEGPLDRRQLAYSGYVPVRPETIMSMTDRYNYGGYLRTVGQQTQQEQQLLQQQQQQQQQQLQQQQQQQQPQQPQQPSQVVIAAQQPTGGEVDGAPATVPAKMDPKDLKPAERKKNVKN